MARSRGIVLASVWKDEDWLALSRVAQRAYLLLISQAELSNAGVIAYTPGRWARYAADDSRAELEAAIAELEAARFVLVDRDTEELLIRTLVRHDGIESNPKVRRNAQAAFEAVSSRRLELALVEEFPHVFGPEPLSAARAQRSASGSRSVDEERALDLENGRRHEVSHAPSEGASDRASSRCGIVLVLPHRVPHRKGYRMTHRIGLTVSRVHVRGPSPSPSPIRGGGVLKLRRPPLRLRLRGRRASARSASSEAATTLPTVRGRRFPLRDRGSSTIVGPRRLVAG